ncbi:MAG: hypothetical protein Rubg2KO_38400 [Rubricoccaceae bacterium]
MTPRLLKGLPVALATALVLSACSSSAPTTTASPVPPSAPAASSTPAPSASTARSIEELEAIYYARIEEGRTRFVQADTDFMTGMIGHHAQALVMSAWAPTNGANPAVQRLAARIINAQQDEIKLMQKWLRDRDQPVPLVHIEGSTLTIHMEGEPMGGEGMSHGDMNHEGMDHDDASSMDHDGHDMAGHNMGGHDHMNMPGMLSQTQMDELEAAQGVEFDRLFLKYMIQHHGGAITMVDALFSTDGAANDEDSFKFASDVQVDQRTEIARMQQMLDALPDPIP